MANSKNMEFFKFFLNEIWKGVATAPVRKNVSKSSKLKYNHDRKYTVISYTLPTIPRTILYL